jgi:tripartite-type tricarboxylate transporter receptor subunit TctC
MKKSIRLCSAALICAAASLAQAQSFPTRPITILVAFAAGGSMDVIARTLAPQMEKTWRQPVVIENRAGAGGGIAMSALAKSAPDGQTLVMGGSFTNELFVKDPGFERRDIVPVSVIGQSFFVLLGSKPLGIGNLRDFVAYAKANPRKVNIAVIPASTLLSQSQEMLDALGIEAALVSYKGIAPIQTALLAGEVQATLTGSGVSQVKSGQAFGLAVGGERRFPDLPDVPTFKEQGFDFHPRGNFVLFARAGTPPAVLAQIAAVSAETVKTAEFQSRVAGPFGVTPVGSSPDAAARELQSEYDRTKRALDKAGVKPQ